jgi:hypothetical protein
MHQWSNDGGETWSQPIEIMPLAAAFGGDNALAKDSAGVLHVVTAVNKGVFSAAWDGTRWLAPEQIEGRNMDPHGQQLIVCQGNQLHVVYDDRIGDETTVWYSHRVVDTPLIGRGALPPPNPQPSAAATRRAPPGATITVEPVALPVVTPVAVDSDSARGTPPSILGSLLLASMTSVVTVSMSVLVFRAIQRNRR